jgi:predicted nucleic acid-binding Zn ribbon protein
MATRKCIACGNALSGAQLNACSRACRNKVDNMKRAEQASDVLMRNRFLLAASNNSHATMANRYQRWV